VATTEQTINDALGAVLMETRSLWRYKGVAKSENVDVLKGSDKKPDILITEPNVSPVIVETEILPAHSVESDAKEWLGEHLSHSIPTNSGSEKPAIQIPGLVARRN